MAPAIARSLGLGMTEPTILQGYSYPSATLTDVLAAEVHQGRTVRIAIQHAGGWVVSSDTALALVCSGRIYMGDDLLDKFREV